MRKPKTNEVDYMKNRTTKAMTMALPCEACDTDFGHDQQEIDRYAPTVYRNFIANLPTPKFYCSTCTDMLRDEWR